jgi:uncharacterized membrane protein
LSGQELSVRSLAFISLFLTGAAAAQTPGFWLVGIATGASGSEVRALNQDGSVAVGFSIGATIPGFRWTAAGGRQDFGLEAGMPTGTPAYAVNSDGSIIVGDMYGSVPHRAYRRVGAAPLQDLGPLLSYQSVIARGVSGDGNVVVGHGETISAGTPFGQACRWTPATGMQPLGWLRPGSILSQALDVSRDGTTIVGESMSSANEAFVWR